MSEELNRFDSWDHALATSRYIVGAQNPSIVSKQPHGPEEWLYAVTADTWAVPSQFADGNMRRFLVWTGARGSAIIWDVGFTLAHNHNTA